MDMGRIPPSETYRRASFQADSLGETPIRLGYASGAYPPRIRIGYVSDTDTGSPARIGVTEPVRSGVLERVDNVKRGRGKPKLTWDESVKKDLKD